MCQKINLSIFYGRKIILSVFLMFASNAALCLSAKHPLEVKKKENKHSKSEHTYLPANATLLQTYTPLLCKSALCTNLPSARKKNELAHDVTYLLAPHGRNALNPSGDFSFYPIATLFDWIIFGKKGSKIPIFI